MHVCVRVCLISVWVLRRHSRDAHGKQHTSLTTIGSAPVWRATYRLRCVTGVLCAAAGSEDCHHLANTPRAPSFCVVLYYMLQERECVCVYGVFVVHIVYERLDPWCSGPPLQEVGVRETPSPRRRGVPPASPSSLVAVCAGPAMPSHQAQKFVETAPDAIWTRPLCLQNGELGYDGIMAGFRILHQGWDSAIGMGDEAMQQQCTAAMQQCAAALSARFQVFLDLCSGPPGFSFIPSLRRGGGRAPSPVGTLCWCPRRGHLGPSTPAPSLSCPLSPLGRGMAPGGNGMARALGTPPGLWVLAGVQRGGGGSCDPTAFGAGATQGVAGVGDGLDHRKCFDTMPQGIVFEVCTRLGWEAEVLAALQAMYCKLVRAFKVAGGLGDWWRATNGILQGCPLLVILVNSLMGVWKAELDSLRDQVVVVPRDLPPYTTLATDDSTAVVLKRQGLGRAGIGPGGYADDTEVVAPSAAALRHTVPATRKWLRLTAQDVKEASPRCGPWIAMLVSRSCY